MEWILSYYNRCLTSTDETLKTLILNCRTAEKQEAELKAKLAARRKRKQKEAARKAEEDALKRLSADEELQGSKLDAPDLTSGLKSDVNIAGLSMEEQAVIREHERVQEEMRKRHGEERTNLNGKLDDNAQQQEASDAKKSNAEREKLIREKKNKQAAELAARKDLSEEEMAR
ncbi:uncharacterized protein LOC102801387, partial [Saccoglossus kowalevskii]|uniref:Stress response protein NST1-like n=1 Tax=Saccoglossus kowalevskii TaxID=10224 RepID=A0ABM0LZF2_SACKO